MFGQDAAVHIRNQNALGSHLFPLGVRIQGRVVDNVTRSRGIFQSVVGLLEYTSRRAYARYQAREAVPAQTVL